VVLATDSGSVFGIAVGAFLALCLLVFVFAPRDVLGRRRATGCAVGLAVFFALFVGAFAVWAADNIF
jgi:hypothetical protein